MPQPTTFLEIIKSELNSNKPEIIYMDDPVDDEFKILKTDEDKRLVFGWGSVSIDENGEQLVDHQGDIIDPEDLEEAAYDYVLNFRDTGEEHIPSLRKKGKLIESVVLTYEKQQAMGIPPGTLPVGWWVGFKIYDDRTWELIKTGKYKMFSIEGKAQRIPVEKSHEIPSFFNLIEKFNPYHDRLGRFTTGGGFGVSSSLYSGDKDRQAVTFSANPDTKAGANAIARHGGVVPTAYGMGGGGSGGGTSDGGSEKDKPKEPQGTKKPKEPEKPKYEYDPVASNKEAASYLLDSGIADSVSLNGVNKASIDHVNEMNETLTKLTTEHPIKTLSEVKVRSSTTGVAASANYTGLYPRKQFMNDPEGFGDRVTNQYRKNNEDMLNSWKKRRQDLESNTDWNAESRRNSADSMIEYYNEKMKYSRHNVVYKGKEVESVITHEYGHILADQKFRQINPDQRYSDGTTAKRSSADIAKDKLVRDTFKQAKQSGDIYKISEYASTDHYEFLAESFAMKQLGEEKLPQYIDDMITEVFK